MNAKIAISLLALPLLLAGCGKSGQPAGKSDPAGKAPVKAPPAAGAGMLGQTGIKAEDVLVATRTGEKVTLRWAGDFSADKSISILRNDEGTARNRQVVAKLPPSGREFVDTAPDPRVHWYWIGVEMSDATTRHIGPVRVRADALGKGKYARKAPSGIELIAQRTEASVVVAWDLPKANYRDVVIRRRDKTAMPKGREARARMIVHNARELSGDFVDTLPEPISDYWYWIEATKEDGTTLTKGPVRARTAAKAAPKAAAAGGATEGTETVGGASETPFDFTPEITPPQEIQTQDVE
jgi:hypothetical protein